MPEFVTEYASGASLHDLLREVFALHAVLSEVVDEIHEKSGLRTSWIKVANSLSDQGAATVPDVALALNVSRQFVQTVFNDLQELGMLSFKENPRHKRSRLASLTGHGREILAATRKKEAAIIKQVLPGLDARTVADAQFLLKSIREQVRENI